MCYTIDDIETLAKEFAEIGYVVDDEIATSVFLLLNMQKPLLIEGHAGVGKTEIAIKLAEYLDTELIRLQCYEGLDINSAVYEWNYQRQLLSIKMQENLDVSLEEKEDHIFSEQFLLERPLLKAISSSSKSPVLLIDEIDRADEEFEALLLELLSEFQISIPELKTIKANKIPFVILTSNRTRELSDALKRRCLYLWVDYPSKTKEMKIVKTKNPKIEEELALKVVDTIQLMRNMNLNKVPGVAETLDWVNSLVKLKVDQLSEEIMLQTLGCVLKTPEDLHAIKTKEIEALRELILA